MAHTMSATSQARAGKSTGVRPPRDRFRSQRMIVKVEHSTAPMDMGAIDQGSAMISSMKLARAVSANGSREDLSECVTSSRRPGAPRLAVARAVASRWSSRESEWVDAMQNTGHYQCSECTKRPSNVPHYTHRV